MGFFRKSGPRKKKPSEPAKKVGFFKRKSREEKKSPKTPRLKIKLPMRVSDAIRARQKPERRLKIKLPMRAKVPEKNPRVKRLKARISDLRRGGDPIDRPQTRVLRRKWRPSISGEPSVTYYGPDNLPPGVETIIAQTPDEKGFYRLLRATKHETDHIYDKHLDYWRCNHAMGASSWVASIALVVLEAGGLGLMCQFWSGAVIAYVWGGANGDDTAIWFYNDWIGQPSKGKYISGKFGPSMLKHQPYIKLASGR